MAYKRTGDRGAVRDMTLDRARENYQHHMRKAKDHPKFEPHYYEYASAVGHRRHPDLTKHLERATDSLRRYVNLAHRHGIDPKHGLKQGARSFDEHMAHIKHVSHAEAHTHMTREADQADREQNLPEHGTAIKHPHTGKVVGHWHSYYPDEADTHPNVPAADYHPHGQSYGTKKQQSPHLHVQGTASVEGRKNHAKEVADVIHRDYGKRPKVTHGQRASSIYVDRPEDQGTSNVVSGYRIPTRVRKEKAAKRAAQHREKAASLPPEEAHPEMAKAHAKVREHYARAEKADRKTRSRALWNKWRDGTDNGEYHKAGEESKKATADYHDAMHALHATAKKLGVHPAHGFAPQSDIKHGTKAKTRQFRHILADLHGAHRSPYNHANRSPRFEDEKDADQFELALHRHVGGRVYRYRHERNGRDYHHVDWNPLTKKQKAEQQSEWVRSPLLVSLLA